MSPALETLDPLPDDTATRRTRLRRRWLLVVELAVVIILSAVATWSLWTDRWVQDDAYISFRFAKNMLAGGGLVYNPGQPVEGYTNFTWTVLSAIPMALGAEDPVPFMHGLSLVLWLATLTALTALGFALFSRGVLVGPLIVIPVLAHWSYGMWFFSAMETPLVCFLTVLSVVLFARDPGRHPRSLFWAALAATLLLMSRPDALTTMVALALSGVALHGREILQRRNLGRLLLLPALPVVLLYLPYTMWRLSFYGDFFPNTYYAKVAYLTFWSRGWEYLRTHLDVYPLTLFFVIALGGAAVSRGLARRFLWPAVSATVLAILYVVRLGGDFMEWRFLMPVTGILLPAVIVAAALVGERIPLRWRGRRIDRTVAGTMAAALCLLALTATILQGSREAPDRLMPGQETIPLLARYCDPDQFNWMEVGRAFDAVLPPGITIATTSAGAIPFFCNRPCLDLHGLTDPVIARQPVKPTRRGRMGHEHWLHDLDEISARGVDVYLYWADPKPYAEAEVVPPDAHGRIRVSIELESGRFADVLVLRPDRLDLDSLRQDPRAVLWDPGRAAPPERMVVLAEKFAGFEEVAHLDLENHESEAAARFEEIFHPEHADGHVYHTKVLPHRTPFEKVLLRDSGRRIYHRARWQLAGLDPSRLLVMVVRYDHSGPGGVYRLTVNDATVPSELVLTSDDVAWDETSLKIPADALVEGINRFQIERNPRRSEGDAQFFRIWFLQRPDPEPS